MIAKGEFAAEVVEAVLTTSQNTQTEQVAVQFRLLEGPDEGQTITDYQALTDAALPYTVEKLRRCGWVGDDVSNLETVRGNKVRLVLVHEEYQGKTRARVRFVNEYREQKRLDGETANGIASRLRAKIAALEASGSGGGAKKSGAAPANGAAPRDDIPF